MRRIEISDVTDGYRRVCVIRENMNDIQDKKNLLAIQQ